MEISDWIFLYVAVGFVHIYILHHGGVRTNWRIWYAPPHKRVVIIFTTLAVIFWPIAPLIMQDLSIIIVRRVFTKVIADLRTTSKRNQLNVRERS